MQSLWGWLTGTPAPTPRVKDAQACYPDELDAISQKFAQAVKLQGNGLNVLQEHAFLKYLCGLPPRNLHAVSTHTPPEAHQVPAAADPGLLGAALFRACCGYALDAHPTRSTHHPWPSNAGVSLDDLVVAKAACERMGTSDSHAFAFHVLCELAELTASHNHPTPHAHAPSSPMAAASPQQTQQMSGGCSDAGISLEALERCLEASLALLEACGALLLPAAAPAVPPPPPPLPAAHIQQQPDQEHVSPPPPASTSEEPRKVPFLPFPHAASIPRHVPPPAPHTTETDTVPAQPTSSAKPPDASTSRAQLQHWVRAAARGALLTAAGPVPTNPAAALDLPGYSKWVKSIPAWHTLYSGLLSGVPHHPTTNTPNNMTTTTTTPGSELPTAAPAWPPLPSLALPRMPQLLPAPAAGAPNTLLHPAAALLLASCMAPTHREEWQLVFHSDRDGKSFNTLLAKLTTAEGPTLILVKEAGAEGHVVAGYAPVPWVKSGAFTGDHTTWVARLTPDMQVFTASGANTNFMWCGQGFNQLTNGIAFGGAQGPHTAYALLIDSSMDTGQSRPIATFGSPSLTHDQVFRIETVEAWLLQQPEEDPHVVKPGSNKKSVLDKLDKADKLILELGGRQVNHRAMIGQDEPLED